VKAAQQDCNMDKYYFVRPLLNLLGQARFFHRALAMILRVCAGLVVLFSLTTFFQAGKLTFDLPANAILGGVLFEACFILAVYAAVHVLLIRARDIERLEDGDLYALRTFPLLLRMLGEAYACFVSLVGVGAGIFVWFTAMSQNKVLNPFVRSLFPSMREDASFMGGIEFMLSGVLISIAALVVSYIAAEAVTHWLRKPKDNNGHGNGTGRQHQEQPFYKSRLGV
jgi:hypothetical protein